MGQYYMVCNLDRQEYLNPHKFGDGLKLLEFGCSMDGTMTGLAVLLADGNNRGGGDLCSDNPIVGSWKGNRIVVTGDYADPEEGETQTLYERCQKRPWKDISDKVLGALCDDNYIRSDLQQSLKWRLESKGYNPVPVWLRRKLQKEAKETEWLDRPSEETQVHIQLARQVLRAPDCPTMWRAFLDACLERAYQGNEEKRIKKDELTTVS